jgi:tRNA G18 (ribose-2'-O)-methylase SpoU
MYNDRMTTTTFQIRLCTSCGLRYPLTDANTLGTRCPVCMGSTRLLLTRALVAEPKQPRHPTARRKATGIRAVLMDNLRSAWNVGSIFRSADGFGFAHAYLCGITPTPENEAVIKTSLGAEDSVTWSYHKDAVKLVRGLKKEGWLVSALEDDQRALSIRNQRTDSANIQAAVLILGNEVTGVDPELLDLCDKIYYIPMRGEKKSFNVAMAFSIAAYQLS